jgi:surface carbohydrate biosynthesis protein
MESVVVLVDNKTRDLDVAALLAHHLRGLGVECHLEPLEAFRAVLAAYKPGLVLFNHMTAGHQAAWSRRLAEMNVLTAVLPNEGISYDRDTQAYNAGRFHANAHIDYFFCWNEPHRTALVENRGDTIKHVEVIGVPRFDFYFEPWSKLLPVPLEQRTGRPRVLFCTNFSTARYNDLPKEQGDRLFSQWAGRIPLYNDYWNAIKAHGRARVRVFDYLNALVASDRYDIVVRPHPGEDAGVYEEWFSRLTGKQRENVKLNLGTPIAPQILACDIEISCETCTTALESWIAKKPTAELVFERHPLWYWKHHAQGNAECGEPSQLAEIVERELKGPADAARMQHRKAHLAEWCSSPDGTSTMKLANIIAKALCEKAPADWTKLNANDRRRAMKLRAMQSVGQAYHYDPLLSLKARLFPGRYTMKRVDYDKSIMPADVAARREHFEKFFVTQELR